jgi:hypothetical protein
MSAYRGEEARWIPNLEINDLAGNRTVLARRAVWLYEFAENSYNNF